MILVIDNFDSFTYNLVQYFEKLNYSTIVKRNNAVTIKEIEKMNPKYIVLSPGPGSPKDAGVSVEVVNAFKGKIPILGVCLGHQSIGAAFGGKIIHSKKIIHGKTSNVEHDKKGVFSGLPSPLVQTRYHSLIIEEKSLPDEFEISAKSEDGEIMGIRHKKYAIEGVQFHPESIASEKGFDLLNNFLSQKNQTVETAFNVRVPLASLMQKKSLSFQESQNIMEAISNGEVSPVLTSSLLTALQVKGETPDEIAGFAKVMQNKAITIRAPKDKPIVDTCGTGGDHSGTFNISTLSGLVVAAAGACVAKHGNRSITSKCGSADLLESLGVNLEVPKEKMEKALSEIGFAFLFAQKLHPSMKNVIGVRKELKLRTVFNILGPLANPAKANYQVMGVFEPNLTETCAKVLQKLETKRALVVHGSDGLDEITLTGPTRVTELNQGTIKTYELYPEDLGLTICRTEDLQGGDIETNKLISLDILNGKKDAKSDIVALNAGAALYACEIAPDLKSGVNMAQKAIDSKKALEVLNQLIDITHS